MPLQPQSLLHYNNQLMTRIRTHANPFHFRERFTHYSLSQLFSNPELPLDFEIGCGRGSFLENYAQANPNRNLLGVEIRKPAVELIQNRLTNLNLSNVAILPTTGQICLEDVIPDNSISQVFIFHPDPWFKKSHYKRRIVNPKLLETLDKKMQNNSEIFISTDVQTLYFDMKDIFTKYSQFQLSDVHQFWQNSYQTNWSIISQKDSRLEYFLTYKK